MLRCVPLKLINARGQVRNALLQALREVSFQDEQIVEILAHVALNLSTNYVNVAFAVPIDFPAVKLCRQAARVASNARPLPGIGLCAQLMAPAMGSRVGPMPHGRKETGFAPISLATGGHRWSGWHQHVRRSKFASAAIER